MKEASRKPRMIVLALAAQLTGAALFVYSTYVDSNLLFVVACPLLIAGTAGMFYLRAGHLFEPNFPWRRRRP